jgi:hypothetical protein
MTGLQLSNLNRAITKGVDTNVFALPKGKLVCLAFEYQSYPVARSQWQSQTRTQGSQG